MSVAAAGGRQHQLEALHVQTKTCTLCSEAGYWVLPPSVLSGAIGARIMTIGQAPGPTEQQVGRPFNGGSGRRLFDWLRQAGIDEATFRAAHYMTSVTKCYPGRGKSGSGDRLPTRKEQVLCRPYLDREIELVDPQLIIPIGKLAIGMIFDKRLPLTKIIGQQCSWQGRTVIPLPHPSGASTWHQKPTNKVLLCEAIGLIAAHPANG